MVTADNFNFKIEEEKGWRIIEDVWTDCWWAKYFLYEQGEENEIEISSKDRHGVKI